jgi:hypothetical protein
VQCHASENCQSQPSFALNQIFMRLAILFGADFMSTSLNIRKAHTLLHLTFHHSSFEYGNEHFDSMRDTCFLII